MGTLLTPVDFTAFGSPVLYAGEIEHLVVECVDLLVEDDAGGNRGTKPLAGRKFLEGHARLTTHRLLWIDASKLPKKGDSCALQLASVMSVYPPDMGMLGMFNKKAKLRLRVWVTPSGAAATDGATGATQSVGLALTFRAGRHDDFYARLLDATQKKEWRHAPIPQGPPGLSPQGPTLTHVQPFPGPLQPLASAIRQGGGGDSSAVGPTGGHASSPGGYHQGGAYSSPGSLPSSGTPMSGGLGGSSSYGGRDAAGVHSMYPQQGLFDGSSPGGGGGGGAGVGLSGGGHVTGPSTFATSKAGVAGILRREERQMAATSRTMEEAFEDLSSLMAKAREMVRIAEFMHERLLEKERDVAGRSSSSATSSLSSSAHGVANPAAGGGDSVREDAEGSAQEMRDWLLSMGIANPVTRDTAGSLYHQELSRQLAGFLDTPLKKAGGIMALPDVYCLFNRARGTELISPEDLVKACEMWSSLEVPFQLRRFDSGVLVVQAKSHSDDQVCEVLSRVVRASGGREGINLKQAAAALGVAIALAKEHLLTAEARGLLCRDESLEGLRFHHNFFRDVKVQDCRVTVG
eukprot:jgi/Mesvir1/29302/Mv01564-RA.1